MNKPTPSDISNDVQCLNENTLEIDLDALELEVLDQRLELALAALFGHPGSEVDEAYCGQLSCMGYAPGG